MAHRIVPVQLFSFAEGGEALLFKTFQPATTDPIHGVDIK